jgi:MFS family permease
MSGERQGLGGRFHRLFAASLITNLGDGMGTVAYPWLASAITRNPVLIAGIAVAQRLPWLVFSLPAGVITDRVDRRKAIVLMDMLRFAITAVVGLTVLGMHGSLPAPDQLDDVTGTRGGLYVLVLLATLLLGSCEVLRDNSAQTILPAIVEPEQLERANGRLGAMELVANTFAGPPLASLLLGVAFALPILFDAASFFGAAALVFTIGGTFRADHGDIETTSWRVDLKEGMRWLRRHEVLFPMAVILGFLNLATMVSGSLLVLFAQDVLHTSSLEFALLGTGIALGGVIGGATASYLSKRLGAGTCLAITLGGMTVFPIVNAFSVHWVMTAAVLGLTSMVGVLWNVITVSFRQSIIPPRLLGRINSAYRFFAWGMMPIGAGIGGVVVATVDAFASRSIALRATFVAEALICGVLFVAGRHFLSTDRIERARSVAKVEVSTG